MPLILSCLVLPCPVMPYLALLYFYFKLLSINAINGHTTDYIDVDSFTHLLDTLHKPPLSALYLLQTISAKRSRAIEDTGYINGLSMESMLNDEIHPDRPSMTSSVNYSNNNSTSRNSRHSSSSHHSSHHPLVIQLIDSTEHILLPYGFELDAIMTPSHAMANIPSIAQFRVPMMVVPPLLMNSYRYYRVARWAVAKARAMTRR